MRASPRGSYQSLHPFRRGRCPHRPAGLCVQGSPPIATGPRLRRRGGLYIRPKPGLRIAGPARAHSARLSVSKKSFRHAVRIFKLSKKFKNTCRLNAKGAFCPLHTSPAALSQTSSARFFDSLGRAVRASTAESGTGDNINGFGSRSIGRGAHTPPWPGWRNHRGLAINAPGLGGMWACRPTPTAALGMRGRKKIRPCGAAGCSAGADTG